MPTLLSLQNLAHDAAVKPHLWPQVLRGLTTFAGADGGMLTVFRAHQRQSIFVGSCPPADTIDFSTLLALPKSKDEVRCSATSGSKLNVTHGRNGATFAIDPGMADLIVVRLDHTTTMAVLLFKNNNCGAMGTEIAQLDDIRTHLSRSAKISMAFDERRIRSKLDLLSMLNRPAAILAGSGALLSTNDVYDALRSRLRKADESRSASLGASLDAAVRWIAANPNHCRTSIGVPAQIGLRPLTIEAFRISATPEQNVFGAPTILAVVSELVRGRVPDEVLIRGLFGLTSAEARIASGIAAGETVEMLATRLKVTTATVRFHLKSVFAKTLTARQTELAALLSSLSTEDPQPDPDYDIKAQRNTRASAFSRTTLMQ